MKLITLDFETYYDKDYTLSKMTMEAYVRDPRFEVILVSAKIDNDPPAWFSGSKPEVAAWLEQFNLQENVLLCHNTAFDGFILNEHFGIKAKFYLDTMSMAKPKHGQTIGVSLKALADKYTIGMKGDEVVQAMGKHLGNFTAEELYKYADYCCNDVQLTYMLFQILRKDFPKTELRTIDLMLRMYVDPVLEVDSLVLHSRLKEIEYEKEQTLKRVQHLCGQDVLMSNQKFADALRQRGVEPPMKVSPITKKETYAFAKTDQAFQQLLEHENPEVQALVAARLGVKSTIEETRARALINISNRGRLPVLLNYYGAHTGRASGGDGINPQNFTRGSALRQAIVAPEGYSLVACDSAQIEARITAWMAGENKLVQGFREKRDVYSEFATMIYERPITKKSNPLERHVGKTCILGLGYGMSSPKLQLTLRNGTPSVDLEVRKCADIVNLYRNTYRRISAMWTRGTMVLFEMAKGNSVQLPGHLTLQGGPEGIQLPNGMLLRYPHLTYYGGLFFYAKNPRERAEWVAQSLSGKWTPQDLTLLHGSKVIENVVQALARIVVFDQMVELANRGVRTVLSVHDELVTCVKDDEAEQVKQIMLDVMSTPPTWAPSLPIAAEANIGKTYGAAK